VENPFPLWQVGVGPNPVASHHIGRCLPIEA